MPLLRLSLFLIVVSQLSLTTISYATTDSLNRLTKETQADSTTLEYQYDSESNRTSLTLSKGSDTKTTLYSFDALNRLASVIATQGTTTYSYDNVGNRSQINHANGNKDNYVYDALNRLTSLTHQDSANTTQSSYTYTLTANGKRSKITEATGRITDYTYDNLNRLKTEIITDASNGNYNADYQYDKVGNRTYETVDGVQTQYTIDNNDRLTQQGGTTYSHDNNGNTISETLDSNSKSYTYNAKNQLTEISNAGSATRYQYNADGIREAQTTGLETTQYIVDSNRAYAQVLEERLNNTTTVSYTYGDDLLSQTRNNQTNTYHYDGLGSTRALSNATGIITDTYNYEAFGEVLNQKGVTINDYLFAGEQFDANLDQYYLRARYYDQNIGRFTQQDTWMGNNSDPVTLHKYLYANADPVNHIDPSGNFSLGSLSAGMRGMATLANIAMPAYEVFRIATGDEEVTAKSLATEILLSKLPIKYVKNLYQKACRREKNSFVEGTLVYSEFGLIPIEQLNIENQVLSYNEETGYYEFKEIIQIITGEQNYSIYSVILDDKTTIHTTNEHPFYVSGEWLEANELTTEDNLTSYFGELPINLITTNSIVTKVYNISVKDNHNYLVTEKLLLTHNTDLCDFITSKVDPNKVRHAMSSYRGRTWQIGGHKFRLTRERMKHILERHHPKFFDLRKAKKLNTPLPSSWSLQDVETAVLVVINQNRSKMIKAGSGAKRGVFYGNYQGVRFKLGINSGRIGQFTPLD